MRKGKIIFKGNFWEYFLISLGLLILCVITFGLLIPYFTYWNFKYFFTKLELEIYDDTDQKHMTVQKTV